jgi:hypothetical protein
VNNIHYLIAAVAARENALRETPFVAPRVAGGRIAVRVAGLVCTFEVTPTAFEGWGIFAATDASDSKRARLLEPAPPERIDAYLRVLPARRLRLAHRMTRNTWIGFPLSGPLATPVPVHLVEAGVNAFEAVVARWDGRAAWFHHVDRRANPRHADRLTEALGALTPPYELRGPGLTPHMRAAYELAANQHAGLRQWLRQRDEANRVRRALERGGGQLLAQHDRGDYWTVEWRTADGMRHTSAIARADLTVMSAGICLAGRDGDFDLQSLVGVVEQADAH